MKTTKFHVRTCSKLHKKVHILDRKTRIQLQDLAWRLVSIHMRTWTEPHEKMIAQNDFMRGLAQLCTKIRTRPTIVLDFKEIFGLFRLFG